MGKYRGGDGMRRDIQVLTDAQVSLISERRKLQPYGLGGGQPGLPGQNRIIHAGIEEPIPSKGTFSLQAGDIISIRTPGGGGFGLDNSGKADEEQVE